MGTRTGNIVDASVLLQTVSDTYEEVHAKRWSESLKWIAPFADKAERILDVGGESRFTEMIRKRWPGKLVPYYGGDLRNGFIVRDCDLIICTEILEHIEDAEHEGIQTEWKGTGVHNVLASCWMSLRPGGHLFVTTPNPCSITAIHHALNLAPPMIYPPHYRELTPYQLDEMVRSVEFEILRRETLDVWRNAISDKQHRALMLLIKDLNYPDELRGEDVFLLCRKPETTTAS
jgi:SAM-dependent methyltransferase